MDNKLDAETIINVLMQKYASDRNDISSGNDEWICYPEFFSDVGGWGTKRRIDLMAFQLYKQGLNIVAHEVKVSRADFKQELERFEEKQGVFMAYSTEFYYVCPWGMIQPDEVPEGTGLMWVNAGNKIIKKKVAKLRPKDSLPWGVVKSFIARQARGVSRYTFPVKYIGKDITDKDINEIVDNKVKNQLEAKIKWEVENRAKELAYKMEEKRGKWLKFLSNAFPYYFYERILNNDEKAIELAGVLAKFQSDEYKGLRQSIDRVVSAMDHIDSVTNEYEKDE